MPTPSQDCESRRCKYCGELFAVDDAHKAEGLGPYCSISCHDAVEMPELSASHGVTIISRDAEGFYETEPAAPRHAPQRQPAAVETAFSMLSVFVSAFMSMTPNERELFAWFIATPNAILAHYAKTRGLSRERARQMLDNIRVKCPQVQQCWPKGMWKGGVISKRDAAQSRDHLKALKKGTENLAETSSTK